MVRDCINTIVVETPQHIFDTQTAEYVPGTTSERDVFYEIMAIFQSEIPLTEDQSLALHTIMWNMYRHRMISACDVDYWVDICGDHLTVHGLEIKAMMDIDDAMRPKLTDDSAESVHSEYDSEDLPDTATGSTAYINNRTKTDTKRTAGLNTRTAREMLNNIPNGYRQAAELLEPFFLQVVG